MRWILYDDDDDDDEDEDDGNGGERYMTIHVS